jgi:quercetin dioxygenase-like cupin family protein
MLLAVSERRAAFVVVPGQELPAWSSGRVVNVHATAERTGGALGFFENTDEPGVGAPLHAHPPDEAFYVIEGSFEFYVDGEWLDAPTGSFVFVPGGLPHGFRAGPDGGRKIGLFVPAGNEGFFTEWGRLHDLAKDTPDAIAALADEFGVQRLGPLPERDVAGR